MPHPAAAPRPSPSITLPCTPSAAEGCFAAMQAPPRTGPQGAPPWNG
ncbi:hypothetical protein QRO08_15040 [Paracidovorax citrulli]|uniref:Uncharacterized protein n=1 Tax=Paracidovorax citrulli TaxID=80869 RepID=A0ABY9AJN9_PARCI|nr:hypothetical protein [Paracidovorax citrulli]WIY47157.1 hypothetical protein QRO08_15040 [Paracidovorax citrulli]